MEDPIRSVVRGTATKKGLDALCGTLLGFMTALFAMGKIWEAFAFSILATIAYLVNIFIRSDKILKDMGVYAEDFPSRKKGKKKKRTSL